MQQLTKIKINHKVGYKNSEGEIVIQPQYDDGQFTFSIYASVVKEGKCGVIDTNGDIVIPFEYEEAYHLFDCLFAVRRQENNNKWLFGVINTQGKIIVPFEYEYINHLGKYIQCVKTAISRKKYTRKDEPMDMDGHIYDYSPKTYRTYSFFQEKTDTTYDIWFNEYGEQIYAGIAKKSVGDYLIIGTNKLGMIDYTGKVIMPCCYLNIYGRGQNRFVVCKKNEKGELLWGVMNNKNEAIINIEYQYIDINDVQIGCFFKCFNYCNLEQEWYNNEFHYKILSSKEELWINYDGIKIYTGNGKILSDDYLAVCSNGKWGVITQKGEKIVNFLYDDIDIIQGKFVVANDKKVGMLNDKGCVVISLSYNCIENVAVKNTKDCISGLTGQYGKSFVFDTTQTQSFFYHKKISVNKTINISAHKEDYALEKFFILTADLYSELFTMDKGIVPQSRFDEIRILNNNSFAVYYQEGWGVFVEDKLVIPCEYDKILFEGGNVVLLNKGDLWGAKSILQEPSMEVNVPIKFKEITILNAQQNLFGVKQERREYDNSTIEEYTIVNRQGETYEQMSYFSNLDRQCVLFDSNYNRILASKNGKYGFVSSKGYIAIPFQYDSILIREDGLFDVRVNKSWGVIDISGKEIVGIKYSEAIPLKYNNVIVKNVATNRYGILAEDGTEKVPSIYGHLMIKNDLIFFGYNGIEGKYTNNFFSSVNGAIWGVMDKTGKVIIDASYDCFKIQNEYILAGRNGHILYEDHNGTDYGYYYSGVYDIYTHSGVFLFGGCTEFIYDNANDIYILFLGGEWTSYSDLIDEYNNIYYKGFKFQRGIGLWLFLDKKFKCIIRNKKGIQFTLKKGFTTKIDIKKVDNKKLYVYNLPIDIMAKGFSHTEKNCIIVADSNNNSRNYAAINITTGEQTPFYSTIEHISDSIFFFLENGKVGIRDYKRAIETACLFITYPVNDFCFVAKEIDATHSCLILRSIKDIEFQLFAIKNMETRELIDNALRGRLVIKYDGNDNKIEKIILPKRDIFDRSFTELVSPKESFVLFQQDSKKYWFSADYRMNNRDTEVV